MGFEKKAFRLGTRFSKRVTFSSYDWEVSRNVIEKKSPNRNLYVWNSRWILKEFGHRVVTGFKDATDPVTGETIKQPIYDQNAIDRVDGFYKAVVAADKAYSETLDCAPSIKHTTVKPSGTVAKLAGVSEGMHFHYSNYLIQRIRSKTQTLCCLH